MSSLQSIVDGICDEFEAKNAVRDEALRQSRQLIRLCANTIRALHRDDFVEAEQILASARQAADKLIEDVSAYPDLYFTGYTQDALKELSEAYVTYAFVRDVEPPTPQVLKVESAAYLNGLADAAGELRRYTLDRLRTGDVATGERLLRAMDEIYSLLVTVDFPDAITGGLRRATDMVRGVLERTRGDLTTAVRQEEMKTALRAVSQRIGLDGKVPDA
jgi:translin